MLTALHYSILIFIITCIASFGPLTAQYSPCAPKSPNGSGSPAGSKHGRGDSSNPCCVGYGTGYQQSPPTSGGSGISRTVVVIGSSDSNDIIGPAGYGDEKRVSVFYRIHIG